PPSKAEPLGVAHVGFVGLGVMGGGVTRRLLAAGHTVHGYNRSREKAAPLVELGLVLEDTPRQVAEAADVVFSMVTNVAALEAVTQGPDGILAGLGAGKIYVDMTTGTPEASRALSELVAERGARMLDAPVSGSVSTLEEGRLSIMVGGDEDAFAEVEPILLDIGPTVMRIGSNGQALLMKIAINLSLHVQMVAFCEGLLLAEKDGIDKEVAVEALLKSVIASPMLAYRGPFVLEMPDEAWFNVNMMQKDMNLALEAGRKLDVPMPTTAISNELLTAARAMGLVEQDFAVVYEVMAHLAGLREVAR
ncbi:MAG TPA: NAD(P)-dependent oxidoreductase, partial [Gaiellaceae bacterium]|nr:NAD(P)-dependent oxidoreductase [Gaiellaceae bacterium]